jgi:hypothetical protein
MVQPRLRRPLDDVINRTAIDADVLQFAVIELMQRDLNPGLVSQAASRFQEVARQ